MVDQRSCECCVAGAALGLQRLHFQCQPVRRPLRRQAPRLSSCNSVRALKTSNPFSPRRTVPRVLAACRAALVRSLSNLRFLCVLKA